MVRALSSNDEQLARYRLIAAYHHRMESVIRQQMLECTRGGDSCWEYADPAELLRVSLEERSVLQRFYDDALTRHPCSAEAPWHMIVAFNEVAPSNKLKVDSSRKAMNCIFNFNGSKLIVGI